MGSIKCSLRKETKNEIAKYIDNEFINETIKEIVKYIKEVNKVKIDDSNYNKYDINSKVELKDNGPFNIYDYTYVKDFIYELSWEGSYIEDLEEFENNSNDKIVFKYEPKDIGTVLYEIAEQSKTGIRLNAEAIPVQDSVKGVCGMLGLEPLYLACEGRLVIFAPKENAEAIVAKLGEGKYSSEAAIIGEVTEEMPGRVVVTTEIGAETLLPPPGGELLPRIC